MGGAAQAPSGRVDTGKVAGRRELRFESLDGVLAEVERLAEAERAGVRTPRVEGGTLATEPAPLDEGLERLRRVLKRLKFEAPTAPNVIFGPLTHEEWLALHCRHAELHLGFFVPEGKEV